VSPTFARLLSLTPTNVYGRAADVERSGFPLRYQGEDATDTAILVDTLSDEDRVEK